GSSSPPERCRCWRQRRNGGRCWSRSTTLNGSTGSLPRCWRSSPAVSGTTRSRSSSRPGPRLTPEQRRGSAPLPDVLPLGDRLASAFRRPGDALPACAHRALVLAATSGEPDAGPVVAALRAEGHDPQAALAAAERAGVVALDAGRLTFTHPLLRSAVWSTTPAAERRSAHAALAAA